MFFVSKRKYNKALETIRTLETQLSEQRDEILILKATIETLQDNWEELSEASNDVERALKERIDILKQENKYFRDKLTELTKGEK